MKKALSINNIKESKHKVIPFTGQWLEAFGEPERTGTWLIWGGSGNGKSSFAMMLCEELCRHGKVLYNSLEEGTGLSLQQKLERIDSELMKRRFNVVNETIAELSERLKRRRSADFVVIDSFQYSGLNYDSYRKFKEAHQNKLLIFISHADGKRPSGRSSKSVLFDASLKIWVEGFKAFSNGRFIGANGGIFTIWEEGAFRFWGEKLELKH
jgi:hypothetical protein